MSEYLILLKLNPGKIAETLGTIRSFPTTPTTGVDLCYAMNIFGTWDVGIWINAENSTKAVEFVQKKVKDMAGVTEVYTVPTFPHGNTNRNASSQETREPEDQKRPLKA